MATTPDTCPVCGADLSPRARACPECGADEQTGWSDKAKYDSLGIPDDSFDYESFVQEEFGSKRPKRRLGWLWVVVAVLLLVAFLSTFLRR